MMQEITNFYQLNIKKANS